MSAVIIDLAEVRARGIAPRAEARAIAEQPKGNERFHFWTGSSGHRYVHTVYSLIGCPALPSCNYMLIKRNADGECDILAIGRVTSDASSLNLAEIRRRGAELGANEVHVHLLANTAKQAKLVQTDLQASHLDTTWQVSQTATVH